MIDLHAQPLLQLSELRQYYPVRDGLFQRVVSQVKAVDGINLTINHGEVVGLVGESGCGKTTLGRTILRMIGPTSGSIMIKGQEIGHLKPQNLGPIRAEMQMVFQNPFSSLNPRMRVKDLVAEPLQIQKRATGIELQTEVQRLLSVVGLGEQMLWRFPRDLSGGQRQRVAIARALALTPDLLILDEPTSALDVSVQTQVLNLLDDLQQEFGLTYLFISHDLGVIRYICDRIAVMYMGRIVEMGSTAQIFQNPQHPYTKALLSIMADPGEELADAIILKGEVDINQTEKRGCRFANRCWAAKLAICEEQEPDLVDVGEGHEVACFLYHDQTILDE